MGKKALSSMTAQQFVEIVGALGGRYQPVANGLNRSATMVSLYATGRRPIPVSVELTLRDMIAKRSDELRRLGHAIKADDIASMIVVSNTIRQSRPGRMPAMCRRLGAQDGRVYPPYRLDPSKFTLLTEALVLWHNACVTRRQESTDARDIRALDLELADLKSIVSNVSGMRQRGVPYDMLITFSEWFVISRALRHETNDTKYALYQHWRRHKGTGYPRA